MATADHEELTRSYLDQVSPLRVRRLHSMKHGTSPPRSHRHKQGPQRLRPVSPNEKQLQQREQGWNDRFFYEPPTNSNKLPRPDRPASISAHSPVAKERKIREERAQYGAASNGKPDVRRKVDVNRKPQYSKLMPLGSLARPPTETHDATKEEKIRFKVLKLIDARETLLYQLSALILCTPVQESLFMPSRPTEPQRSMGGSSGRQLIRPKVGMALAATPNARLGGDGQGVGGGAMTNAREATKMAQKLAMDLQEVGIQCVEALVEWMLEAGAKAEKPPPFLWRGRNYFLKMYSDLDFTEAELKARGVYLDCYTQKNPLLIRPEQKLGRVLAAQSIINEMIEMTNEPTPQEVLAQSPSLSKKTPEPSEERVSAGWRSPQATEAMSQDFAAHGDISLLDLEHGDHHDGIESERSDYSDDSHAVNNEPEDGNNAPEGASSRGGEDDDIKSTNCTATGRDPEAEVELVTMLDESLSNFPSIRPPVSGGVATNKETDIQTLLSPRTKASNQSAEYDDNNFDEDEADADGAESNDDEMHKQPEDVAENEEEESNPADEDANTAAEDDQQQSSANELSDAPTLATAHGGDEDKSVHHGEEDEYHEQYDEQSLQRPKSDSLKPTSARPSREILLDELDKWARAPQARESLLVSSNGSLEWDATDALESAVRKSASPVTSLQSSLLWALAESLLVPPHPQLQSFLNSATSQSLNVCSLLRRECCLFVSSVCGVLAGLLERAIQNENPLVSEIDVNEVLEIAESVFRGQDDDVWKYVGVATSLLTQTYLRDVDDQDARGGNSRTPCRGLSELVNVFYPYLTNQPRERLPQLWIALSRLLARYFLRLCDLAYMLNPTLKSILLVVASLNGGKISDYSDITVDPVSVPKLSLVCERGDVLRSSVDAVWTKRLSLPPGTSCGSDQVFPFFRSSFGEKLVEGAKVEEGEGRGPLKEWFSLLGEELAAKWRPLPLDLSSINTFETDDDEHLVTASGNVLMLPPSVAHLVRPGLQVEWRTSSDLETAAGESTVTCIINKQDSSGQPGTFLLDRGVASQSFSVTHLRLAEPRNPVFEYVRASESFRLNAQTVNNSENRRRLTFVGWLLATAVTHCCSINLRLHPLMFTLLLRRDYHVTLDDVRALDPTLFKSMEQVKAMPASNLASLLELEGADPALNADEYVASVLDSTFGTTSGIGWQLEFIRQGFDAVASLDLATKLGISGHDLTAIVGGSNETSATGDFRIDSVFRIAADADFTACRPLHRGFWRTVNAFDPLLKRKLIKFITGVDTLPLPGIEFLRIEMPFPSLSPSDHARSLQMLPQAHTCDNTLELPHYWKALCWQSGHDDGADSEQLEAALGDLLTNKLRTAIEYSEGYGLDGTSSVVGVMLPGARLASHGGEEDPIEKEESYESLDLPALQSGEDGGKVSKSAADAAPATASPDPEEEHDKEPPAIEPPTTSTSDETVGGDEDREDRGGDDEEKEEEEEVLAPPVGADRREESYEENDWEDEEVLD